MQPMIAFLFVLLIISIITDASLFDFLILRSFLRYKHYLIKPIVEDHLCNFADSQHKSLYKTEIVFVNLKFNKFSILKLRMDEYSTLNVKISQSRTVPPKNF